MLFEKRGKGAVEKMNDLAAVDAVARNIAVQFEDSKRSTVESLLLSGVSLRSLSPSSSYALNYPLIPLKDLPIHPNSSSLYLSRSVLSTSLSLLYAFLRSDLSPWYTLVSCPLLSFYPRFQPLSSPEDPPIQVLLVSLISIPPCNPHITA